MENAGITQLITENMTETFKPTKKRTHFIRNSYLPMAACSADNSEQMFWDHFWTFLALYTTGIVGSSEQENVGFIEFTDFRFFLRAIIFFISL